MFNWLSSVNWNVVGGQVAFSSVVIVAKWLGLTLFYFLSRKVGLRARENRERGGPEKLGWGAAIVHQVFLVSLPLLFLYLGAYVMTRSSEGSIADRPPTEHMTAILQIVVPAAIVSIFGVSIGAAIHFDMYSEKKTYDESGID
jgi:hypothetical protein